MTKPTKPTNKIVTDSMKKSGKKGDGITELASGIRVKFLPVSAAVITELQSNIKEPDVPVIPHPSPDLAKEGQTIEHPDSPTYKQALAAVEAKRIKVGIDAMVMFGVELVDGVPEDKKWIKKLSMIGITDINEDDEVELEFAYKKYMVVDSTTLTKIAELSGVTAAQIDAAKDSFPS